jgi:putative ABC transport system permease protein
MLTVTLAGLRVRWRRLLLSAAAVALGVAFVAGTLINTATVHASYYSQFAAQAKNVDAAVEPASGARLPLPDLGAVRAVPGVAAAEGRMAGSLPIVGADGRAYAGIAQDLPADPRFRDYKVLSGGGSVLLDEDTAALDHVTAGTPITVVDENGHRRSVIVTGIVDVGISNGAAGGSVLILPAATVQALTGVDGYQRIDVAAAPGVSQSALAARLAGLRLPRASAVTGGQLVAVLAEQNAGGEGLLSTGLLIFALVSLLVAALVIYNSFRTLLAGRLREVALLRCVGATRRQVMTDMLTESTVLGLVASVAGLALGTALAAMVNSGSVTLTPATVALSLAAGVVVTDGAALLPALAASRTAPVAALTTPHEGKVSGLKTRITLAAALGASGLGLTAAGIPRGLTGLLMIAAGGTTFFLGFLVIGPLVAGPLASGLGWLPSRLLGVRMRLATAGARRNPARTATTTVALTIGVGLMTLFSVVLSTASQFAANEANRHFPADYLLSAGRGEGGIPEPVVTRLRASSQIAVAVGIRQSAVSLDGHQVQLLAAEPAAYGSVFMPLLYAGSLSAVQTGTGGIALSGVEASALHVTVGGTVSVAGHPFVVDATFSDGVLDETAVMSWTDFTKLLGPGEDTEVAVKARPGVSTASSAAAVDAAVADYPLIDVTSQASLRAHLISSIQKIATLFDSLLATSIVIALFGMANTLSLSVLERTRESALLRALGLTRQGLRWMISLEAMLLGLMGAVAGVAFGLGFGWATARAFLRTDGGPVSYPVLQVIGFIALAGVAALVASVLPARRAARLTVIDGLAADLSRPGTRTGTWPGRMASAAPAAAAGRQGKITAMSRPPWGRGAAVRAAPWVPAMARTMARPSPCPSPWPIRWGPSCRNGWKRSSTACGGMRVPVLPTVMTAPAVVRAVLMSARPPGRLCRMALSMRLAIRLSARLGSPVAGAGASLLVRWMPWRSASPRRARITLPVMSARSSGWGCSSPRWLFARVSRAAMRRSCRSPRSTSSSQVDRSVATEDSGSAIATWSKARPAASGVRSSWEAFAMKCRCDSKEASRRANRSSSVSPSSVNSSPRPRTPRRRCRLLAEMSRAVVMIPRSGRTNRPAISQPSARESTAMIATAATAARNASELMNAEKMPEVCPAVTVAGSA